uniref:Uncharacterized protein n=1 Tax=Rhizophora mucronata TaxID=61149 RepID=A0A2P2QV27_RHIMU
MWQTATASTLSPFSPASETTNTWLWLA